LDIDRLTYMANQIARNLAPQGEGAVALTLQHLRDYWDPRMKAAILAGDRSGLDPIAKAAVEQLGASG
jgi:formate dehydrogenase subunit delta